ncbi:hypothetical protein [Pseudactinotalea sp.]|uniref:hypothetical protein n=1 Tax=Pseudactinotalea sp. TaxID=1926260 RepID=UPI003B3BBCEA
MAGRTGVGHSRRLSRALAALAIGAAAAAGVGACSPITTQLQYAPSDGNRVVLGDELTISNLLVLTTGEGEPALVVGGVTNHSPDATTVSLTFGEADTVDVRVDGNSTVLLNPAHDDGVTTTLAASPVAPGANLTVTVATAASGTTSINVTVLDGTLAPYDEYLEYLAA